VRKGLSLEELVLLAAKELTEQGKISFSAEDLVIAAWKRFPDSFGLEGYGNVHPDSNRVFTKIMGAKGLRGRGWLLKTGEKLYQLSDGGRLYASTLSETGKGGPSRASLSRKEKMALRHLLDSKSVLKLKNGLQDEVVFGDACSFWDISPRSVASTLNDRVTFTVGLIDIAKQLLEENDSLAFVQGDVAITQDDLTILSRTHQFLLEKFQNELDIIRERKDDRRS
jgi:hypothetical protein